VQTTTARLKSTDMIKTFFILLILLSALGFDEMLPLVLVIQGVSPAVLFSGSPEMNFTISLPRRLQAGDSVTAGQIMGKM